MAEETYISMRGDLAPKALKLDASSLLLLVFSPYIEKLAKDNQLQPLGKCPNSSTPLTGVIWLSLGCGWRLFQNGSTRSLSSPETLNFSLTYTELFGIQVEWKVGSKIIFPG